MQRAHVGVVLRERHRRRPDVAADVEELHRAIAAEVGERIAVPGGAGAAGAADLDQLLDARVLDQRVEHRVGQPQALGELRAAALAGDQRLQQQLRQRVGMQSGLGDRRRRRRRRRLRRAAPERDPVAIGASSMPLMRDLPSRPCSKQRSDGRAPVPDASSVPAGQLEHAGGAAARQPDPPGLQVRHAVDDDAGLVEREHVDGEPHAPRVHAAARHDPQRLAGFEAAARQQPDGARRRGSRRRRRVSAIDPCPVLGVPWRSGPALISCSRSSGTAR